MREIRAAITSAGDGKITGYAALFDTWSKPISERGKVFRERLQRGALEYSEVSLWWMHSSSDPLANTKSGTLTISQDERGISFTADLGQSQRANEIRDLVARGVVSEMSIGFVVTADIWSGTNSRTVTRASLHEVSLVENAAYSGTYAQVRAESKTMTIKELGARVAELRAEYETASEDRQLEILTETAEHEERIASERAAFSAKIKAPAVFSAPVVRSTPKLDETREWFRGGFRSQRAITLTVTGGNSSSSTLPQLSNEFIKALDQESVLRSMVSVETRSVDTDVMVINARLTATQIAESGAYVSQDFSTQKVSFKAWKSGIYTDVTEESLQDTIWDVGANVVQEHARAHSRLWEGLFHTGAGSTTAQGMFNESATTWGTVHTCATPLALPIVDDLVAAAYKLNPAYMQNASWLMNMSTWANIVKTATNNKYALNGEMGNILKDGAVALFLGKPVYLSEFAPTATATGKISVLFGDFKRAYRIVDRSQITFTVDDLSQAINGAVRFSSRMRTDGKPVDLKALVAIRA